MSDEKLSAARSAGYTSFLFLPLCPLWLKTSLPGRRGRGSKRLNLFRTVKIERAEKGRSFRDGPVGILDFVETLTPALSKWERDLLPVLTRKKGVPP